MTNQILAFLFCFKRELNPYTPPYLLPPPTYPPIPHTLTAHTLNPLLPPKDFVFIKPLVLPHPQNPSVKSMGQDLSKKIHYNTKEVVTTKPTQVNLLNVSAELCQRRIPGSRFGISRLSKGPWTWGTGGSSLKGGGQSTMG